MWNYDEYFFSRLLKSTLKEKQGISSILWTSISGLECNEVGNDQQICGCWRGWVKTCYLTIHTLLKTCV